MTTITSRYFNQHTSKVQKAAERAPVIITRRGEPSHVLMSIAILTKPYTALRRFAVQPRTVFSGAPCIELCEYCYIPACNAPHRKAAPTGALDETRNRLTRCCGRLRCR